MSGFVAAGGFAMPCAPAKPKPEPVEPCPGCHDPECDFDCDGDYDGEPAS